jgi:ABC-type dipeptide/oligopeptide/nickel transport system permease subunit
MMFVDAAVLAAFLILRWPCCLLSGSFIVLVIVVGIDGWERYARLSRGMTLQDRRTPISER